MNNFRPDAAILALADLVEQRYVLAEQAIPYAATVRSHVTELSHLLPDMPVFNRRLHTLVPDRHLSLRHHPTTGPRPPEPQHGGIRRVDLLADGVAVVEIHPHFREPAAFLPHLRTAAERAMESRAVILDLRSCGGGDTDSAALVHGWLLGPDPVPLGTFEHRGRPATLHRSDPGAGLHHAGPVRVLTSARTFSGGEELAYVLQALGRARVVGEQTAGGAHPVEHFPLPGGLWCQIPVARSIIHATGTNWEGTGVTPDVRCAAGDALELALDDLATLSDECNRSHATGDLRG